MSNFAKLKSAKTLHEVAAILGYKPDKMAYILYKMPDSLKYTEFEIIKRSGGVRKIKAPTKKLKLLQRRVANILYDCMDEIEKGRKSNKKISHGFNRRCSIITNALPHKNRRYVFNVDLKDFFPSINFGRVRGVLIKDKRFSFCEKVATLLSQVACHDHSLPQGSPCSPILSNIVANLLDARMVKLAKKHKCTYTRYADDITFSTNQSVFPKALAIPIVGSDGMWTSGDSLVTEIRKAGFEINQVKTRMQFRGSRQIITGLVVNSKVNIKQEYYRTVRSMCSSLFNTGQYYLKNATNSVNNNNDERTDQMVILKSLTTLQGMLEHIYHVRNTVDTRESADKKKNPTATRELYKKFLFYKNFIDISMPLIMTEGKTDTIYLASAIEMLPEFHSFLGISTPEGFKFSVKFLKFTNSIQDVLQLGGGTGDFKFFILKYADMLKKYRYRRTSQPLIMIIDNDEGATEIFSIIKEMNNPKDKKGKFKNNEKSPPSEIAIINYKSTDAFYKICENLYLIKTPEKIGSNAQSCIEDCFNSATRSMEIRGKKFSASNNYNKKIEYGKAIFAEEVVKKNKNSIDFSGFTPLLERIIAAINDYHGSLPK